MCVSVCVLSVRVTSKSSMNSLVVVCACIYIYALGVRRDKSIFSKVVLFFPFLKHLFFSSWFQNQTLLLCKTKNNTGIILHDAYMEHGAHNADFH